MDRALQRFARDPSAIVGTWWSLATFLGRQDKFDILQVEATHIDRRNVVTLGMIPLITAPRRALRHALVWHMPLASMLTSPSQVVYVGNVHNLRWVKISQLVRTRRRDIPGDYYVIRGLTQSGVTLRRYRPDPNSTGGSTEHTWKEFVRVFRRATDEEARAYEAANPDPEQEVFSDRMDTSLPNIPVPEVVPAVDVVLYQRPAETIATFEIAEEGWYQIPDVADPVLLAPGFYTLGISDGQELLSGRNRDRFLRTHTRVTITPIQEETVKRVLAWTRIKGS
jgi:hypothetical protein